MLYHLPSTTGTVSVSRGVYIYLNILTIIIIVGWIKAISYQFHPALLIHFPIPGMVNFTSAICMVLLKVKECG